MAGFELGGAARIDETAAEGGVFISTDDVLYTAAAAARQTERKVSMLAGYGVM